MLRNLRALLAVALLAVVTPAAAQQVLTNHALAVGRSPSIGLAAVAVGTNGQVPLGQTGADPAFTTLSGDVTSIAAGGAVVVGKLNGVSGPSSGTSGGIPYYSSTSAMSSSAALTANQLVIGGGAGAAPAALGSLGTTTTLLHGNASGAPTYGAVVSGDLNITTTTCTNQFVTAISAAAAGTCTTDTLAGAQHANQGTTTTVLHGNAAGNPSWGSVAISTDVSGLGTGVATFLGTPSSANLISAVTDETGSGALVFGTAPTITLANGTGLPISTGVSGLGTGVATFLATPSSANLASALTDETGSGAAVFAASPSLSGTVDSTQAIKLSGDISPTQITANQNDYAPTGFSTATTLRLSTDASRNITGLAGGAGGRVIVIHNVGSFNLVLTNQDAASTAANRFLFGGDVTLAADASLTLKYDATSSRWRALSSTAAGGGGGGTVTSAAIAAGTGISTSGTCTITTSGTCTVALSTPVTAANGGTGQSSYTTGDLPYASASTTISKLAIGTTGQSLVVASGLPAWGSSTVSGTSVASTSGTSIDFTSIPSWVRKITISFVGVSTNGSSNYLIQIGDSGGVETTGYLGSSALVANAAATSVANYTTGYGVIQGNAANVLHGQMVLTLVDSSANTWASSHYFGFSNATNADVGGGSKSLSPGPLDRVRITTVNGTDTFDAGTINILYE